MKKSILFLAIFAFFSCKNTTADFKGNPPTPNQPQIDQEPWSETTVMCDYELKDMKTGEKIVLTDQPIPEAPNCTLTTGDTLRLCKSYGETKWHVEAYWEGSAEVDHCEHMADAILISIKKVTYHYNE